MNNLDTNTVENADPTRVASIMASLNADTHALTLWLDTDETAEGFVVERISVDPASQAVVLNLGSQRDWPTTGLSARATLCADNDREFLRFQHMTPVAFDPAGEVPTLRCTMPEKLALTNQRQAVRVPIAKGLKATARLRTYTDQPPVPARIIDLSAGGCLLEMAIADGMLLTPDQAIAELDIEGPDGERIAANAYIRHIHAAEHGPLAHAGLEFVNVPPEQQQKLWRWLGGIEREIALRTGGGGRMTRSCAEFMGLDTQPSKKEDEPAPTRAPMISALEDVAGHLGATVIALRNNRPLPIAALNACADTICQLLEQDRQALLYALCCLDSYPPLLQHSIAVAGRLADLMHGDDELAQDMRPAVLSALIHDLGKAMLIDKSLPADGVLGERQKNRLRQHVDVLLNELEATNGLADAGRRDVIASINERLDGSGYPNRIDAGQLGTLSRAASVVDVVDAMTRARGDRPAFTPMAVYRELYNQPERFDREWVTRYIQRHGMTPVGSLVRYSGGFLAWIMALDARGQPARVRLVRNLAGRERPMNEILEGRHIGQLGRLESTAQAQDFGLAPF